MYFYFCFRHYSIAKRSNFDATHRKFHEQYVIIPSSNRPWMDDLKKGNDVDAENNHDIGPIKAIPPLSIIKTLKDSNEKLQNHCSGNVH